MYTSPPATAGDDSPMPSADALYFHLSFAVGEIDRVQLAALRSDVDDAVDDRGGGVDRVAGLVRPEQLHVPAGAWRRDVPRSAGDAAELWPTVGRRRRRWCLRGDG